MTLQRNITRGLAMRYGLRQTEARVYNQSWKLKQRSDKFERRKRKAIELEPEIAFATFAHVIRGGVSRKRGHRYIERRPVADKYVVFSDHHLAYEGHRHNFFARSGNLALYVKLLEQYYERGYTLVEAGDVEELIIFEPTLAEAKRRAKMSWSELDARRVVCRTEQLDKIISDADNNPLYATLEAFAADGRFVRVAGNHDYDIQRPQLLEVIRRKVPSMARPCDYLLLTRGRGAKSVAYAILHGHQFDKYANPRFAPRLGEVISETLAWAYQGADRIWEWRDKVDKWATGREPFNNFLVVDDYDTPFDPPERRKGGAFWEWLFKHNVAWEYFESKNPTRAIIDEVYTGDEFFKYRHLDEVFIHEQLVDKFRRVHKRPKLVLGHSHEPRFWPSVPPDEAGDWTMEPYYYNTAAAGRFENLIFGLEIVDGAPTLVSWSFADGPRRTSSGAKRRVWERIERPGKPTQIKARRRPTKLR